MFHPVLLPFILKCSPIRLHSQCPSLKYEAHTFMNSDHAFFSLRFCHCKRPNCCSLDPLLSSQLVLPNSYRSTKPTDYTYYFIVKAFLVKCHSWLTILRISNSQGLLFWSTHSALASRHTDSVCVCCPQFSLLMNTCFLPALFLSWNRFIPWLNVRCAPAISQSITKLMLLFLHNHEARGYHLLMHKRILMLRKVTQTAQALQRGQVGSECLSEQQQMQSSFSADSTHNLLWTVCPDTWLTAWKVGTAALTYLEIPCSECGCSTLTCWMISRNPCYYSVALATPD